MNVWYVYSLLNISLFALLNESVCSLKQFSIERLHLVNVLQVVDKPFYGKDLFFICWLEGQ